MGTNSSCSNLQRFEDACRLSECQNTRKPMPEWTLLPNVQSYLLQLKKGTRYQGQQVSLVVYSVVSTSTTQGPWVHLCSFIKQTVEQGVCPFFAPVYSLGYNCDKEGVVVVHGLTDPQSKPLLQTWPFLSHQDKLLVVFQLLYVCHVLQMGHFDYGLSPETLHVVALEKPKTWSVATDSSFFEFQTVDQLSVAGLPVFPPNRDMHTVRQLCSSVRVDLDDMVELTLMQVARQLNIVTPGLLRVPKDLIGIQRSFLKPSVSLSDVYQNLQSFSYQLHHDLPLQQKRAQIQRQIRAELAKQAR